MVMIGKAAISTDQVLKSTDNRNRTDGQQRDIKTKTTRLHHPAEPRNLSSKPKPETPVLMPTRGGACEVITCIVEDQKLSLETLEFRVQECRDKTGGFRAKRPLTLL